MARRAEGAGGAPESMVKTAKACSRFGHERSEVARRAEGAGGAPESTVAREWLVSRKTAKACSRFGHERSEVARRAEGAGGAPESTQWEVSSDQ